MASSTVAVSGAIAAAGASARCRNRAARVAAKAPTARLGAREFVGQRLKPERVRSRRSAALAPRAEAISDPVEEKDAKAEEVSRGDARDAASTFPTPRIHRATGGCRATWPSFRARRYFPLPSRGHRIDARRSIARRPDARFRARIVLVLVLTVCFARSSPSG